ncbi:hypothetical protein C1H76_8323 [Elsinoe australis]|uniref:Uncharacterized protein n=1 Tax=Elsinoe australis TaxID=40998 RepID=A0A4U7AUZ9_9PEZI|nr:hypothetical protein C1H76_8323 [Elsinoe australis]
MGTRNLILIYHAGKYKIAQYSQWDGYPSGAGLKVLKFLADPANLPKLIANLDKLYEPTQTDIDGFNAAAEKIGEDAQIIMETDEFINCQGPYQTLEDIRAVREKAFMPLKFACPPLSRDIGADILQYVADAQDPVPIQLALEFIADTIFCEWAYVVDADEGSFEVYSSSERYSWLDSGRFAQFETRPSLLAKWGLDNLPNEAVFLHEIERTKMEYLDQEDEEGEEKGGETEVGEEEDEEDGEGADHARSTSSAD